MCTSSSKTLTTLFQFIANAPILIASSSDWWVTAGETFEHEKPHFITLIYRGNRPAPFEFQRRLLALRSKAMFPLTPPAKCSSSLGLPPIMLMMRTCSPSSQRMPPLSQSRYRFWISFVVRYSCCGCRLSAVVVPMLFWSHDTQKRLPLLWSTFIRQTKQEVRVSKVRVDRKSHYSFQHTE